MSPPDGTLDRLAELVPALEREVAELESRLEAIRRLLGAIRTYEEIRPRTIDPTLGSRSRPGTAPLPWSAERRAS